MNPAFCPAATSLATGRRPDVLEPSRQAVSKHIRRAMAWLDLHGWDPTDRGCGLLEALHSASPTASAAVQRAAVRRVHITLRTGTGPHIDFSMWETEKNRGLDEIRTLLTAATAP